MLVELGGDADEEELYTELWQKWRIKLKDKEARVYEFLVKSYSEGITDVDLKVVAKHCGTSQNALIKEGGIFAGLEAHGLVERVGYE